MSVVHLPAPWKAEPRNDLASLLWNETLCCGRMPPYLWAWGQPKPSAWQILCCHQACIFTNVVVCGPVLSSKIYPFFIGNIHESKWCSCFAPWVLKFNHASLQQLEGCWHTIAGPPPECLVQKVLGPENLHSQQSQVTLMLLLLGPHLWDHWPHHPCKDVLLSAWSWGSKSSLEAHWNFHIS